ncbi:MAG: ACT domain-containing protein [Bacteroidetes bacterium]|nr:ACT domain-containing protein [Bacteroidota bacterium]
MNGEKNLAILLKTMKPQLNDGEYVFCTIKDDRKIPYDSIICSFKEQEGITLVLKKEDANAAKLKYQFIAAWITLTVHSSLEAVGLTAAVATALAKENISCNVVAAFYHDHIFVAKEDAARAIKILANFSQT